MNKKVRVFIVDDHPVFRAGLKEVVESDEQFCLAGEAADGATRTDGVTTSLGRAYDVCLDGVFGFQFRPPADGRVVLCSWFDVPGSCSTLANEKGRRS